MNTLARRAIGPFLPVVLALHMACEPAAAQNQSPDGPHDAVSRLSVGQTVRLLSPGTVVEEGSVSEVDATRLYVLEAGQEWIVDIAAIERLEVRSRPVVKYALWFGVVGTLAGLGARKFRESFEPWHLTAAGVVGGTLVGLSSTQWKVVYPR